MMPQLYALVSGSLERSGWHDYYVMGVYVMGVAGRFRASDSRFTP